MRYNMTYIPTRNFTGLDMANEINCSFIENQEDDENEDGDSPSVDIETIRAKMETKEIR